MIQKSEYMLSQVEETLNATPVFTKLTSWMCSFHNTYIILNKRCAISFYYDKNKKCVV